MYSNNIEQLYSFFIFTILGLLIGVIFDIFRILRKTFKTTDIVTYIEDILFWFLTGILTLAFIFKFNNGELRFYIFIGISIGSIIYMLFISNFFIKINVYILNIIKTFIYKIIYFYIMVKKIFQIFQFSYDYFSVIYQYFDSFLHYSRLFPFISVYLYYFFVT